MLVFISGGVRSGKSSYGESLAAEIDGGRKIYLATSIVYDEEMTRRIEMHREQRSGKGFDTIEKGRNLSEILDKLHEDDTVLLDCLGNLLANEMFGVEKNESAKRLLEKIVNDICKINDRVENLIIISNDVFSDGCMYSDSVVEYIDTLAIIHREIVKIADRAIECVFGNRMTHKDAAV